MSKRGYFRKTLIALLAAVMVMALAPAASFAEEAQKPDPKFIPVSAGQTFRGQDVTDDNPVGYLIMNAGSVKNTYMTFKAKRTGLVYIVAQLFEGDVKVYSTSGRALSGSYHILENAQIDFHNAAVFGVKKGKTYKFRFRGFSPKNTYVVAFENDRFRVSGSGSRARATSLTKGRTYQTVLPAGGSSVKYFKIRLKKKAKVKMAYRGFTNNQLKVSIIRAKTGRVLSGSTTTLKYTDERNVWKTSRSASKLPAGVYYIRVKKGTKLSSGAAEIKWVK